MFATIFRIFLYGVEKFQMFKTLFHIYRKKYFCFSNLLKNSFLRKKKQKKNRNNLLITYIHISVYAQNNVILR